MRKAGREGGRAKERGVRGKRREAGRERAKEVGREREALEYVSQCWTVLDWKSKVRSCDC